MEINKNVTWKPLGEKVVAVKIDTGEYFTMNEVASFIWRAIDKGLSVDEIGSQIVSEFNNENFEIVLKDVEEQISEWKQELLII